MARGDIHKYDATLFVLTIKDENGEAVDVSGAVSAGTKEIIFTKPPPTSTDVTQTASFYTDGTDGKLKYQAVGGHNEATHTSADLDTAGVWQVQAYVFISSKWYHSDIEKFEVFDNLV